MRWNDGHNGLFVIPGAARAVAGGTRNPALGASVMHQKWIPGSACDETADRPGMTGGKSSSSRPRIGRNPAPWMDLLATGLLAPSLALALRAACGVRSGILPLQSGLRWNDGHNGLFVIPVENHRHPGHGLAGTQRHGWQSHRGIYATITRSSAFRSHFAKSAARSYVLSMKAWIRSSGESACRTAS